MNDELLNATEAIDFSPTREAGLARLQHFASRTGRHYANWRNHDLGPDKRSNISALSPWIRHRSITDGIVTDGVVRHPATVALLKPCASR